MTAEQGPCCCRNVGYYVAVYNNQQYLREQAMYTLRARWVEAGGLLCAWDCHGHGKCTMVLDKPTCVCNDGRLRTQHLMVTDPASLLLISCIVIVNTRSC